MMESPVKRLLIGVALLFVVAGVSGCASSTSDTPAATDEPQPTGTATVTGYTCADLDRTWGNNWPVFLLAVDDLIQSGTDCGIGPLEAKKYAALYNYAASLETVTSDRAAVVDLYSQAFELDPQRAEALAALARLNALPEPTPVPCPAQPEPLPPPPVDTFSGSEFVQAHDQTLVLDGEVYRVRGINYYPRQAPWHGFLEEATLPEMATELDLIAGAGFNALRIFSRYDALFLCEPEQAIPDPAGFALLDGLFDLAREHGFKLIVTLNDLPDLYFRPLYTDWARYDAQTAFIVQRYRNDPIILAWDLRNEGDLDTRIRQNAPTFSRQQVLDWLAHTSQLVRDNDPNHLITAGWLEESLDTEPYVDFLSFHHWSDVSSLQARITDYRARTSKPLLLEEIGYHSWTGDPSTPRTADEQAVLLSEAISQADADDLAGWLIWTAFDFVPDNGIYNFEHFFGLWTYDLEPKPALDGLPLP